MNIDTGETKRLRHYLLGGLEDDAAIAEIELQLLSDDHFGDRVSVVENDLIEEFLDDELDKTEAESFIRYFLSSPERRRRLRLTKNLRDYSAKAGILPQHERSQSEWTPRHSIYRLRFVLGALLFVAAAAGIWRFAIYQSDTDKSFAQLRQAYKGQRPLEPRISAFSDYVAYTETRGPAATAADPDALRRAEVYLLESSQDPNNAKAHQSLALINLAQKKYDAAIREFEIAVKAAPNDASLQTDSGAAYLEIAKSLDREKQAAKIVESQNESLKHLDLAIALDPKMPEPRFNRALCLEFAKDYERARTAWKEYLTIDPASKWADEARSKLQALESETLKERSAVEIESDFLTAFRSGDEAAAGRIGSQNRELIRDKYLPSRLATSYLNAPDERRDELLRALLFDGKIELKMTGDPFANEIAFFYRDKARGKFETLRKAQENIRLGYDYCLTQRFGPALERFKEAEKQFAGSGDEPEADLARYFEAYALINSQRIEAGLVELKKLSDRAEKHGYRWFETTVKFWLGGGNAILRQPTKARLAYERGLAVALSINDPYAISRHRLALAEMLSEIGQSVESMRYLHDVLDQDRSPDASLRQRYRDLASSVDILGRSDLLELAVENALESVAAADRTGDQMFVSQARGYAGMAYFRAGRNADARQWLNEARDKAHAIVDERVQQKTLALIDLRSGELELRDRNYGPAEQYYLTAARYFDQVDLPYLREEAHNGLMLTFLAGGKTKELEDQIPENISLAEEYRARLIEGEQRTSYFETKQNVFDIAADLELTRGNPEKAYDYAEMSSSRSLLDRMDSGRKPGAAAAGSRQKSDTDAKPLGLKAIRESMPAGVQIVQYSVLNERMVIWLVSKDRFEAVPLGVGARDIDDKAQRFARSLARPAVGNNDVVRALGRELYDILILPVRDRLDPKKEVCLIPSKSLFNVSFAALVSPDGRSPLADLTFLYSPSANAFLHSTEAAVKRQAATEETLLAVGNPSFDRSRFGDLPDVEDAAAEANAIAAIYAGSKPLAGGEATKKAFLEKVSDADVVHFAGHYVNAPGMPSASYLLFAANGHDPDEDELTNRELSGLTLPKTRLVVLSACQTGLEAYFKSEGMIGMSRTFLAADVPIVVASQWNVDSSATAELMKRFHRYRHEPGTNSAGALRRAQLDLMNDASGRYSQPYYWAGFAVFGGSASF